MKRTAAGLGDALVANVRDWRWLARVGRDYLRHPRPRRALVYFGFHGQGNLGDDVIMEASAAAFGDRDTVLVPWEAIVRPRPRTVTKAVLCMTGLSRGMTALLAGGTLYMRPHWRRRLENLERVAPGCRVFSLGVGFDTSYADPAELERWRGLDNLVKPLGARGPLSAAALIAGGLEAVAVGDTAVLATPESRPPAVAARRLALNVAGVSELGPDPLVTAWYRDLAVALEAAGWSVEIVQVWSEDQKAVAAVARTTGAPVRVVESPAAAALSILADYRIVISTRLHGAVLATMARVPTIAIAYHSKCVDYMESIGSRPWCVPGDLVDPASIVALVHQLDANYEAERGRLDGEVLDRRRVLCGRIAWVTESRRRSVAAGSRPADAEVRPRWGPERIAEHGFVFVTDRVPLSALPTGFIDRYSSFLTALLERGPTTLVIVLRRSLLAESGLSVATIEEEIRRTFPTLDRLVVRPQGPPLSPATRLVDFVRSVRTPRLVGTPLPDLAEATDSEGVLILAHATLAHLGWGRARSGRGGTIYLLEEGMERAPQPSTRRSRAARRLQAGWSRVNVRLSTYRVFDRVDAEGDPVVVMSEAEAAYFARWIRPAHLVVIPDSVPMPALEARHSAPRPAEALVVGVFGRMAEARNAGPTTALLEEWRRGRADRYSSIAGLHWLIVGTGPPDRLRRLASDQITVTGYVADIAEYYHRADVAVIPSSSATGNKSTLLKAWAFGLPVVISPAAAATMPVHDGGNALVAEGPAEQLRALERLSTDAGLRQRLVVEGHRSVAPFESASVARRLVELADGPATVSGWV